MVLSSKFLGLQSYLTLLIITAALIGDYLVGRVRLQWSRALIDNATHAVVGGLSWTIVCLHFGHPNVWEILQCTVLSSLIDADHFIRVNSLSIEKATSLPNRPFLHCSTIPMVLTPVLLTVAYRLHLCWLARFSFVLLAAFASHHTRDATRRGYWIYPFGSTDSIPYPVYISLTAAIPYLVCICRHYFGVEGYFSSTTTAFSVA